MRFDSLNLHRKKKTRKSLRNEILFVFVLILFATVALCWLVNSFFLERIYVNNKINTVKSVYEYIYTASENDLISSDDFDMQLQTYSLLNNVGIAMMTSGFQPFKVYSTEAQDKLISEMVNNMSGVIFADSVIEENDNYIFIKVRDHRTRLENIEMFGVLPDGSVFLLKTTLESVRQSADLANKVLLIVGISSIVIGSILVYFFTRRITRPILEISELAEKMSQMDFEQKYRGKSNDEIGLLGDSMNTMSRNLEKAISDLKTANLELQKDIEHRNETEAYQKEFVASVSHELKTPIALIQGYAEGLKDVADSPEERDYYCDVIIDESGRMNRMVKQLIDLNRLESGSNVLQIERFDLTALINNYVQKSDIIIKQNNISVTLPQESVFVWADEFKTEEIIMNYFTNAVHYCESDTEKRIDIYYEKEENSIRVIFFNTGNPIPEDSIMHIWDKFYKVDKARTRQYGGSGIGLSIVKAIVEAHNQKCGVYNCEGGVCFWFTADINK